MSWSDRRHFLIAAVVLAGCGFTPVYGPGGAGSALNGRVVVTAPQNDRYAFLLGQELETRLGPPKVAQYNLAFSLSTDTERVAITQEQETNRYLLHGSATYRLVEQSAADQIITGQVSSFTTYSATGTTVATLTAERDANRRLTVILADKIMSDLISKAPELTR
ncbi:LPS assembly lipoprotein LptE [Qingshengfaniella alkalisoli]|uniref:LPS-assembly lipoprotein n=1 Tax=Qingshengfaniella alkalisoli TaxID=2599296 RepID=A0A5B8IPM1_9RHOB|nr:LPS assembly lipoprotein LptE [Qingshengfaniella alkalisoli]QDY68262.1 hypothetical protein FPZ52_00595 [Qingshengfaniella alkalisoli]